MQAQFANPGLAPANGTWLGGPQASLSGSYNGQQKTVLLTLSACVASCLLLSWCLALHSCGCALLHASHCPAAKPGSSGPLWQASGTALETS
jgi:hypothetical protein